MNIVDTMIYIKNHLDTEQRHRIEGELRNLDGIVTPKFSGHRDKLLLVAYNPEKLNSAGLLRRITDMGLEARLVGL